MGRNLLNFLHVKGYLWLIFQSATWVLSKFKTFADYNLNVAKMAKCISNREEILWGKEKMLITSIFSLFPQYFQKLFKNRDCVARGRPIWTETFQCL